MNSSRTIVLKSQSLTNIQGYELVESKHAKGKVVVRIQD